MASRKNIPIKYTSRDFESIRQDLMEHAKRYYPDTYKDFTQASFGSLMIDTVAYVGDILSFYLDYQANESFLSTSIEYENIIKHGRQLGYKQPGSASSSGIVTFFVLVPANSTGMGPDVSYIPILERGTEVKSLAGNKFFLVEDVDFSKSANEVIVANVNSVTGAPTEYAIKTFGTVISGELVEETFVLGTAEKFRTIELASTTITEIITVFDTEGHEYYEVDHLSQNTIYRAISNPDFKTDGVPSIMKQIIVPRRFTTERSSEGIVNLQFGYGSDEKLPNLSIPDPSDVVLERHAKNYFSDLSFDPSNLISTDKFGIAPGNTTITVIYRTNASENVNAPVDTLTNVSRPIFRFDNYNTLNNETVNSVISSLEATNEEPILGDVSDINSEDTKIRVFDYHAAQNRAVTAQDYNTLVYMMPGKFGAIKRCSVLRDHGSFKRNLNMFVVSQTPGGSLINSNSTIKNNVKTWLNNFKMINDTIDILDAKIVNFGIEYIALASVNANRFDLLSTITVALSNLYDVHFEIGERISVSDVYRTINNLPGVVDTVNVKIVPKIGGEYSNVSFDIDDALSADGRFVEIPRDMIAELKHPNIDIKGTIK
tara:strand:+ start:516 stop:2315 length:1800 start_codon:yes stop_codon:yes gene_type:complete